MMLQMETKVLIGVITILYTVIQVSTVVGSSETDPCPGFTVQNNTDYAGNDIVGSVGQTVATANYELCCVLCRQTAGCTAFTFQPSTKKCWTKTARGTPTSNTALVSGYKRKNLYF